MGPSKTPLSQPPAEVPHVGFRRNAPSSTDKRVTAGEFAAPNLLSAAQRRISSKERAVEQCEAEYEHVANSLGRMCRRLHLGGCATNMLSCLECLSGHD